MSEDTPGPVQRLRYIYGATLPPSMHPWVVEDLTGPGAVRRYLLRILVPLVVVLSLFLLVPGPLWMGAAMAALIFLPLAFFSIALTYVYRRYRLARHGMDPALADVTRNDRAAAVREAYERSHGRG
jgi:transposase